MNHNEEPLVTEEDFKAQETARREAAQQEANEITIEQGFLSICNLSYEQWENNKNSTGQIHYSNTEALGAIRDAYISAETLLQKTRVHGGACLTADTPAYAALLQPALVNLAVQSIQAVLSLTDIREAAKKLDHKARIAAVVSEQMANLPVDQQDQ